MRVLVLESEYSWRELGIAKVLDAAPDVTPVLERELADQTWSRAGASVVLVSECAARTDARRSLDQIRRRYPNMKILVHGDGSDPTVIAELIAQGADGYFSLSLGEEKLLKALDVVARGRVWGSEEVVAAMAEKLRSGDAPSHPSLAPGEQQLVNMLDEGLTNKEMAARMGVAEVTIKARLARLCRRVGVRTRVQLLSHAIRHGLVIRH